MANRPSPADPVERANIDALADAIQEREASEAEIARLQAEQENNESIIIEGLNDSDASFRNMVDDALARQMNALEVTSAGRQPQGELNGKRIIGNTSIGSEDIGSRFND